MKGWNAMFVDLEEFTGYKVNVWYKANFFKENISFFVVPRKSYVIIIVYSRYFNSK